MWCFFDKRATVVDVTDKKIIDLFPDGLYHRRTFEDFGRRRPSCITKLKDMITSRADEEDKANAKYDAICGKSKQLISWRASTTTSSVSATSDLFSALGYTPADTTQIQASTHVQYVDQELSFAPYGSQRMGSYAQPSWPGGLQSVQPSVQSQQTEGY
jgi:hypothetical protein